ncbi:MAG TPA: hypothetical protein VF544_03260 [Pyrinomonadaceae bacterium]|jgi:hypothetical protein
MMSEEDVEPVQAVFNEKGGAGAARRLDDAAHRRLTHLLLGKTLAELIFVSALALAFYFAAFPPSYRGWGEATARGIEGWAVNDRSPWQRVEVYLFVDGRFVARQTADLSRPDVRAAGFAADEWHGYAFSLPALEGGEHEASVYAVHGSGEGARYTLQLLGNPVRFRVEAGGAVTAPDAGARR